MQELVGRSDQGIQKMTHVAPNGLVVQKPEED